MTKQKDSHKCNILLQYTIFIGIYNMLFLPETVRTGQSPYAGKDGGSCLGKGERIMETTTPKEGIINPGGGSVKCKFFSVYVIFTSVPMAKTDQIC